MLNKIKVKVFLMLSTLILLGCGVEFKGDRNLNKVKFIKEFYLNDVLKSETNYKNGKKEGLAKYYRENGTLEKEINYKSDLLNGYCFWYHLDGKTIETKGFWVNDKQFGSNEWYYKDGTRKLYTSLDFIGETFFVIKWDEKGQQTKYEGLVFSPNIGLTELNPKVGEEIQVRVAVAQPPLTKTVIKMGLLGKENKEVKIIDFSATYPVSFKKSGKYTIVTIGELYDLKGMLLQRDSLTTDINVSENK